MRWVRGACSVLLVVVERRYVEREILVELSATGKYSM